MKLKTEGLFGFLIIFRTFCFKCIDNQDEFSETSKFFQKFSLTSFDFSIRVVATQYDFFLVCLGFTNFFKNLDCIKEYQNQIVNSSNPANLMADDHVLTGYYLYKIKRASEKEQIIRQRNKLTKFID